MWKSGVLRYGKVSRVACAAASGVSTVACRSRKLADIGAFVVRTEVVVVAAAALVDEDDAVLVQRAVVPARGLRRVAADARVHGLQALARCPPRHTVSHKPVTLH